VGIRPVAAAAGSRPAEVADSRSAGVVGIHLPVADSRLPVVAAVGIHHPVAAAADIRRRVAEVGTRQEAGAGDQSSDLPVIEGVGSRSGPRR
jgi:hypothetical protein